jgi:hypothetical protein
MRRIWLIAALLSAPVALLGCDDDSNSNNDGGLGEDGGGGTGGGGGPDGGTGQGGQDGEPATQLLTISPRPGAATSTVGTPITLTFDGSMDSTARQFVDLHQGAVAGPIVPMTCLWSNENSTLACAATTTQPLVADSLYILHVGSGLTTSRGGMLGTSGMTAMGGTAVDGSAMTMHGGQSTGGIGSGWTGSGPGGGFGYAFQMRFLPIGGTGTGGIVGGS